MSQVPWLPPELGSVSQQSSVLVPRWMRSGRAGAATGDQTEPEFDLQVLANTPWSVSLCQVPHCPLLSALASASIPTLSEFLAKGFAMTAWAISALGEQPRRGPLFEAIAASARRKLYA